MNDMGQLALGIPTASTPTLRPYQAEAVDAALAAIAAKKNGIIVMPTGSGKSLVIAGIVTRSGANVLVLQPTKEILEQNAAKLYQFGYRDIGIYSASAGQKRRNKVTFATIGSVIRKLHLFDYVDVVIIDETHLVNPATGEYKTLIERLNKPTIGLTATPYRMSTSFGGRVVEAKFLHRTRPRIFDHVSYVVQNDDLHRAGYLSPIQYVENADYDPYAIKLKSSGLNYDEKALAAYNKERGITTMAADLVVANMLDVNHYLIFLSSIDESREVAERLSRAGVRAAHVDGETPKREREAILGAFKNGEVKVACNVGVLGTGFDFPGLDGVVLARPTMSLPLFQQQIGRGVRTAPGKSFCRVFDLCGNVARFGKPEEYRIEADKKDLYRLRAGKRYLTGVNFVSGHDLEKARERRQAEKKAPKIADAPSARMPFGKHKDVLLSDLPADYLAWGAENLQTTMWKNLFIAEIERRRQLARAGAP